jgi:hypothetical protein
MVYEELCCEAMNWVEVAEDRVLWWALMNTGFCKGRTSLDELKKILGKVIN